MSLSEAEAWTSRFSQDDADSVFSSASVSNFDTTAGEEKSRLYPSRAYSLALAPHVIYGQSSLLDALVSSRAHNQLEFQAVGSFFIVDNITPSLWLNRVPSSREDVFEDTILDLRAKRGLMKFLRFVPSFEEQEEVWQEYTQQYLSLLLEEKFRLPRVSHGPIAALTLSSEAQDYIDTEIALPRIARHIRSIGVLGPGFAAVLPKWGGLAEIAQVACRGCAVGGGVYVLDKFITKAGTQEDNVGISLHLNEGEKISTKWLCAHQPDLPSSIAPHDTTQSAETVLSRSISIISSPLTKLFPPTSEGGVTPAGAVVISSDPTQAGAPPVHLFVHTSDAGECPMTQSK